MVKISRRKFVGSLVSTGAIVGSFKLENYVRGQPEALNVDIIGHRGFSGLEKDNSMKGFRRAYSAGVDGVELDVRLTEDNRIVLHHDPFVIGSNGPSLISDTTYEKLVEISDITLFDEFLDWFIDKNISMFIGFKEKKVVNPVIQRIRERGLEERSVLLSLTEDIFNRFPDDIETAFASSLKSRLLLQRLDDINPDYVIPHYTRFIDNKIEGVSNRIDGYWLLSEKEEDVTRVLRTNPEVVISNRPDIFIEKL